LQGWGVGSEHEKSTLARFQGSIFSATSGDVARRNLRDYRRFYHQFETVFPTLCVLHHQDEYRNRVMGQSVPVTPCHFKPICDERDNLIDSASSPTMASYEKPRPEPRNSYLNNLRKIPVGKGSIPGIATFFLGRLAELSC
jgi:hypothetical protein